MPPSFRLACCLAALPLLPLGDTLRGEEIGTGEITASPGSLFSPEEISRARRIAAENRARRESYIQAADDDVIVLAPYIVEGDDSLLMARLRRDLDRLAGVRRPWHVGLPESVLQDLAFTRRFNDQFFSASNPGAPRDAVPIGNQLGLAIGIVRALAEKRAGDIFRAPNPSANP